MNRRQRKRRHERRQAHQNYSLGRQGHRASIAREIALLDDQTKPELLRTADRHSITVAKSWNKSTLKSAIADGLREKI